MRRAMIRCAECDSLIQLTDNEPGDLWPAEGMVVPDDATLFCIGAKIRGECHNHGWAVREGRIVREVPGEEGE